MSQGASQSAHQRANQKRSLQDFFNLAIMTLISRFFRDQIRSGSIRAVKLYIQTVNVLRVSALALFAAGLVGSLLVAGIVLIVVGIVGLLPIEPWAMATALIVIGAVLAIGTGIMISQTFSEKRWLEASNSYELMEAALGPWETALPPNPLDLVTEAVHSPGARRSRKHARPADWPASFARAEVNSENPRSSAAQSSSLERPEHHYDPRLNDLAGAQLATPLVP
jgi:hypothetical protein